MTIAQQPSFLHRFIRIVSLILLVALLAWLGGYNWTVRTVNTNLWSLHYLWQKTQNPLLGLLPIDTPTNAPPDMVSAYVWKSRDLLEAGQLLQAESALAPAVASGDYDAIRLQSEILLAQGDIAGAVKTWSSIAAIDDILAAAQKAQSQGQNDIALLAYRAAYEFAPERTVLFLASFLWRVDQDVASAETLLREYITTMPTSRYALSWLRELATLYRNQKAWAKAAAIYEQLLAAAPDSSLDRVQLGWLYYEAGDGAEKALANFQQAVALAPQDGDGYYAIASLLSNKKQFIEADSWYAQALERNPDQQWWWVARANALQLAGNLPTALQVYGAIQQRFPNFAPGYYEAAWVYQKADQREQAEIAIEMALQLMDSNGISQSQTQATYYVRAGQIYEWAGKLQEAVSAYERAAQLDPLRQDVQDSLQRLQ